MRADAMLERGDPDGQSVWLRILAAVKTLLETRPGDKVHRNQSEGNRLRPP